MRSTGPAIVLAVLLAVLAATGASGLAMWLDPALAIGLVMTLLVLAMD